MYDGDVQQCVLVTENVYIWTVQKIAFASQWNLCVCMCSDVQVMCDDAFLSIITLFETIIYIIIRWPLWKMYYCNIRDVSLAPFL